MSCARTQHNVQGAVSRKPRKRFGPVKPLQNLEPCDYRLFYSHILKMKGGSLHHVQEVSDVYTSPFLNADDLKMALRARKLSGAFEKRAPGPRPTLSVTSRLIPQL